MRCYYWATECHFAAQNLTKRYVVVETSEGYLSFQARRAGFDWWLHEIDFSPRLHNTPPMSHEHPFIDKIEEHALSFGNRIAPKICNLNEAYYELGLQELCDDRRPLGNEMWAAWCRLSALSRDEEIAEMIAADREAANVERYSATADFGMF